MFLIVRGGGAYLPPSSLLHNIRRMEARRVIQRRHQQHGTVGERRPVCSARNGTGLGFRILRRGRGHGSWRFEAQLLRRKGLDVENARKFGKFAQLLRVPRGEHQLLRGHSGVVAALRAPRPRKYCLPHRRGRARRTRQRRQHERYHPAATAGSSCSRASPAHLHPTCHPLRAGRLRRQLAGPTVPPMPL